MTRPKITPGHWKLSEDEMKVFQTSNVYNSEGQTITLGSSALPQLQRKANARAIAAVPALLEALEIIHANAAESPEWIRRHTTAALTAAGYQF